MLDSLSVNMPVDDERRGEDEEDDLEVEISVHTLIDCRLYNGASWGKLSIINDKCGRTLGC